MLKTLFIIWKESFIPASLLFVCLWGLFWFITFCALIFSPGDETTKVIFFVGLGCFVLAVICAGFELAEYYKEKSEKKEDGEFIP